MLDKLIDRIKNDPENLVKFSDKFVEREITPRTVLLHEGEISNHLYFIKTGCLRLWFNKDGKDITLQFFFEGQVVASIDSFLSNQPSMFTLESVENSSIISISRDSFEQLFQVYPDLKWVFRRFSFSGSETMQLFFYHVLKILRRNAMPIYW